MTHRLLRWFPALGLLMLPLPAFACGGEGLFLLFITWPGLALGWVVAAVGSFRMLGRDIAIPVVAASALVGLLASVGAGFRIDDLFLFALPLVVHAPLVGALLFKRSWWRAGFATLLGAITTALPFLVVAML